MALTSWGGLPFLFAATYWWEEGTVDKSCSQLWPWLGVTHHRQKLCNIFRCAQQHRRDFFHWRHFQFWHSRTRVTDINHHWLCCVLVSHDSSVTVSQQEQYNDPHLNADMSAYHIISHDDVWLMHPLSSWCQLANINVLCVIFPSAVSSTLTLKMRLIADTVPQLLFICVENIYYIYHLAYVYSKNKTR